LPFYPGYRLAGSPPGSTTRCGTCDGARCGTSANYREPPESAVIFFTSLKGKRPRIRCRKDRTAPGFASLDPGLRVKDSGMAVSKSVDGRDKSVKATDDTGVSAFNTTRKPMLKFRVAKVFIMTCQRAGIIGQMNVM
jgi:hypothetical protein